MWRPLTCHSMGKGHYSLVVSEPMFRCFWKIIRLKTYLHSIVSSFFYFIYIYIGNKLEQPQDTVEESAESVNPKDQDPSSPGPSESARGEHDVPVVSTEALFKISQDMARFLDRLTTPRAPINSVRKHGVEEFHGTSLEELDKAEFWLEKLQRALNEVKCPSEQMAKCAVSLLQGATYDWWKLVLRNPLLPNPIT